MKDRWVAAWPRWAILCFVVWNVALNNARPDQASVFARQNLVAWCVVPFDAKQRSPGERARMLSELGFEKLAYDWREEHVPTFEQEILALRKANIEFFAFWDEHESMFRLFEKYKIHPQIWKTIPDPGEGSEAEKVERAARSLRPLVARTKQLGCRLGLYNHGGWTGEPRNMVAVCRWLRDRVEADHVGIVYNFHHGHDHINDFAESLSLMQPFLLCIDLNGMSTRGDPQILPIGEGQHERNMIQIIKKSGYTGPIGILAHRADMDAAVSLRQNLDGLKQILAEMHDQAALQSFESTSSNPIRP
jgi:hypothetical protein